MSDTPESLHWFALNFRTAHTLHADAAWLELEQFVSDYTKAAIALERAEHARVLAEAVAAAREACAKLCDAEAALNDRTDAGDPDGTYFAMQQGAKECAAAIRNQPRPPHD